MDAYVAYWFHRKILISFHITQVMVELQFPSFFLFSLQNLKVGLSPSKKI